MRSAWGQFMVWVEDNPEATTMIKTFEDEIEIVADDNYESTRFRQVAKEQCW